MRYLLVLILTTAISGNVLDFKWKLWKSHYAKNYLSETDELLRRQIWESNCEKVMHHNKRADDGKESYWLEINQFADMTVEELVQDNALMPWAIEGLPATIPGEVNESVPEKFDWQDKHCVTHVMAQGNCHSCWAFAAVGTVESRFCVRHGRLYHFSEQQLVDCAASNKGCSPQHRLLAFDYIKTQGGLMEEHDYPYKAVEGRCHVNKGLVVNIVISDIRRVNADGIVQDIFKYGPTSSSIGVKDDFHLYSKGIYSNPNCYSAKSRHAVIITGYGPGYWTVKNSWGKHWGDNGYFRIKRDVNMCQIEDNVYSPYLQ